jgi:VCBS repeat-containing protein
MTVTATDPDAGTTLTYSIVGGTDASKFTINSSTGALSFISAPNFESPTDSNADNVYNVTVQASDGSLTSTQAVAVTVTDVNEAPAITSSGTVSVPEGTTPVMTVAATDPDAGTTLTYSIVGGADAAQFTIDSSTGALSFLSAPSYASPTDAGGNNNYDVTVQASDGTLTDTKAIAVTVLQVNTGPTITSGTTASVPENSTAVMTVTAVESGGPAPTFSIVGGADAAKFTINSVTGALSFVSAPDYENPTDVGSDNVYDVTVQADDGTYTDSKAIAVTVTNVNEAPTITSSAAASVAENTTAAITVTATDPDAGTTLTYSIVGGADASKFTINGSTGALSFISAPDYENPTDSNADNVYDVTVQASDGSLVDTQAFAVTVTNVNEAPTVTSGSTASVAENTTSVMTVTAADPDAGTTLTYSIVGGADAAKFTINSSTGALSFVSAPNYENPTDAGADNVYDVTVQASDGSLTDTKAVAVTVTNVNEAPTITSGATASVPENTTAAMTVTATDPDAGTTFTYSIVGGADASKFTIDGSTGALSFISAPDFENPTDSNADNVYDVTVQASDGTLADTQAVAVTVTNVNEAPTVTSGATASVPENTAAVMTVTATDPDAGATLTYSIVGGADAAKFTIDSSTGALSFASAPDFENPIDSNADNVYNVTVQASDGSLTDTKAVAVTVTNVNEAPTVTSGATASVPENTTAVMTVMATDPDAGATLTYSIVGGTDAAKFTIDSSTGALSFASAPDFENPTDSNADNVYNVTVQASDGSLTDTKAVAVTVTNINEAPTVTSGATASVPENTTAVMTVTATDPDAGATLTYSIVGGVDAAKFTIDSSTGALSFASAPDYENPTDAGGDNVYDVTVQASDGSLTDTKAVAVTVTNVNEAPTITSSGTASVAENTTAAITVTATDPDAGTTLTYSIVGGADASKFTINGSTGALSFISAPDFENPTDAGGDNVYDVTVQASDGSLVDTQAFAVTVTNVNEAPAVTSSGTASVPENTTAVMSVTATDPDAGTTLTYSIVGGADAAKFTIDSSTGALSFVSAPDYENPTDAGGDNVYDVTVQASDGSLTDTKAVAVTVTNVNEAPTITSSGTASVAENTTAVTTVTATDPDAGTTLTYSVVGGADASKFTINGSTGALSFISAPDFENPTDSNADNVYDVTVQASDGTLVDTQAVAVTVTNVNEAPTVTSGATASVPENTTAVMTVTATDPDAGTTLTYSIVGGADAAKFAINSSTGALSFVSAPDYENPTDAGSDNVYDVTVQASDGSLTNSQAIAVTVTNVNEAPAITSSAVASVPENTTAVMMVTATDPDAGTTLTYSIVGGADASKFTIDSSTGALSFVSAPDFENPTDVGGDNVYDVTVQASDGTLVGTQAVAVTVTNVNEAPAITSSATASVPENTTAVMTVTATDPDAGATLTYSIVGGADAAKFTINSSTGALNFVSAPDYENPTDAGADNVYDVTVQVGDGSLTNSQAIAVTVTNVNEAPMITSGTTASVPENTTAVMTVTATDPDAGATLTYSIVGGADAAKFTINGGTGALSFVSAPDFENPTDAGGDNVYDVTVQASDGSLTNTQAIAVTVTNVNEAPAITSGAAASVPENTTAVMSVTATDPDAGTTLTYSIVGGADAAKFTIDSNTGALSFVSAPDFENPTDVGGDNVYDVTVQASDGSLTSSQAIAVTVTNVNEAPTIASGTAASVPENTTAVMIVTATDPDAGATLTYSIVGGADASKFAINRSTGALSFVSAPDYEIPTDANADNVYDVTVQASDGSLIDTKTVAVTVTNVNESPTITSGAAASVPENTTAVMTVTATDPDAGTTLTYSIVGGADAAKFTIDGSTGALSFVSAPDYENPTDAGADNVYDVTVQASDGTLTDTKAIAVTVTNVNEAPPTITSGATASVSENTTAVMTVAATDPDAGTTLTYSIVGGADASKFTINSSTGALSFASAPNYEAPTDANGDNVYDVTVQASDGSLTDTKAVAVTVTNVNEAPTITSSGTASVMESSTAVMTLTATDPDAGTTLTYSIVGGADASKFAIKGSTGELSFITAPDYAFPTDAGGDNVYDVVVQVSDGTLSDTKAMTVSVVQEGTIVPPPAFTGAERPPVTPLPSSPSLSPDHPLAAPALPAPLESHSPTTAGTTLHLSEIQITGTTLEHVQEKPHFYHRIHGTPPESYSYSIQFISQIGQIPERHSSPLHQIDIQQIEDSGLVRADGKVHAVIVGSLALSTSVAFWVGRGSALFSSLAVSAPTWLRYDLLPVLQTQTREKATVSRGDDSSSRLQPPAASARDRRKSVVKSKEPER